MSGALTRIIRAAFLRSAARKYARRLGPHFLKAYGASEYYTPQQIQSATKKSGLPLQYIRLGYAAYLPEDRFREVVGEEFQHNYEGLRLLFFSHTPLEMKSIGARAVCESVCRVFHLSPSFPRKRESRDFSLLPLGPRFRGDDELLQTDKEFALMRPTIVTWASDTKSG